MMDKNKFFHFLKSFVYDEAPENITDEDFKVLFSIMRFQDMLPCLYYMNEKYHLFQNPEMNALIEEQVFLAAVRREEQECACKEVLTAFERMGIDYLPVKGYFLADLYPERRIREFGDVDILVRKENRAESRSKMKELGFTETTSWEPSYSYQRNLMEIELHSELMDTDLDGRSHLKEFFAKPWKHAMLKSGHQYELQLEYNLAYLIFHLGKHMYAGEAGLRLHLDIALFIKKYDKQLDYQMVSEYLEQLGYTKFYEFVLSTVVEWFGVQPEAQFHQVDSAVTLKALKDLLGGFIFGKNKDDATKKVMKEQESKEGTVKRLLFPPYETLYRRYTYLEGRKYLLPIAWIDRFFRNIGKTSDRVRLVKGIQKTKENEIIENRNLLKEIGLM